MRSMWNTVGLIHKMELNGGLNKWIRVLCSNPEKISKAMLRNVSGKVTQGL